MADHQMHPALRALHSFFSALDDHTKAQMGKGGHGDGDAEGKKDHGVDEASEDRADEHSKAVMGHVMAGNLPSGPGDADEGADPVNEDDSPVQSMLHRLRHREPFQDHLGYAPGGNHRAPTAQKSDGMPKSFGKGKGGRK